MNGTVSGEGEYVADVAVAGAGPAGSAAALVLARAGFDVVLVERAAFPRDKACGDGLMPDALRALRALGVAERVLDRARRLGALRLYSPNGTAVTVCGEFAVIPREHLDARLCAAAADAGARLLSGVRALAPLEDAGSIVRGLIGQTRAGGTVSVRAGMTVLATGAGATLLTAFGVCDRSQPDGVAARLYVTQGETAPPVDLDCLCISYQRSICPGYGWIFPGPDRSFNVGVGYHVAARPGDGDIRGLFERFVRSFPVATELMQVGAQRSELRGGLLRTGMRGSRLSRPGLLVVGDAAGFGYPVSGEGIGKALESGMLAGEIIAEELSRDADPCRIAVRYSDEAESRFRDRFDAYVNAERWMGHPRLVDFVFRRANAGAFARKQFQALVADAADPRVILSLAGIFRSIFR